MVNITLNLPVEFLERLMFHVERIANAVERIAGPMVEYPPPKPYPATMWGTTSNAESIRIEEEERQEATGYGPSYQREIVARAAEARVKPKDDGTGNIADDLF
jgi:hypothetical protein